MRTPSGPAPAPKRHGPAPLWRRAVVRVFQDGLRAALTFLVFALIAGVGVGELLYLQRAGTEAISSQRQTPIGAQASHAAVVRLVGGGDPDSARERPYVAALARIPNLGAMRTTATSIGYELNIAAQFAPTASANGVTLGVRMFSVPDPRADLSVVTKGAASGVWLPAGAGLRGSRVTLAIETAKRTRKVDVAVAGYYAVESDGRTPRDHAGSQYWAEWQAAAPVDVVTGQPGRLVIADAATARRLAAQLGDTLRWYVERPLLNGASLDQARRSAQAVDALDRMAAADPTSTSGSSLTARQIVSGIPDLVDTAQAQLTRTARPVRELTLAAIGLGLLAVLAMTVATWRRRRAELHHAAMIGIRPPALAGQGVLEHALPAAIGVVAGTVLAAAVAGTTTLGGSTAGTVASSAVRAVLVTAVACALVGCVVALLATLWADVPDPHPRHVPWGPLLTVAAVATVAVFAVIGGRSGSAGWLALVVPLLATLAAGALGGYALTWLAALATRRLRAVRTPSRARFATRITLRRMAITSTGTVVVVTILGAAIGMLLYSSMSVTATDDAIADRAVVTVGAPTVAAIDGSWRLDPSSSQPDATAGTPAPPKAPVVPAHTSVVWRILVSLPVGYGTRTMMVVDPRTFDGAASWGRGAELASAHASLPTLPAGNTRTAGPVPVIAVGGGSLRVGQIVVATVTDFALRLRVAAVVPVFPGMGSGLVAATPVLRAFGPQDPRLRPATGPRTLGSPFSTYVWSQDTPSALAGNLGSRVSLGTVTTISGVSGQPAYAAARDALHYRVILTIALIFIAILALAVYVDRLVTATRATDLMLARSGVGRAAMLGSRVLEIVACAVVAVVAGVLAARVLSRIGPALLEFSPGDRPALVVDVDAGDVLSGVGVAVAMAAVLVGVAAAARRERLAGRALRGE